MISLRFLDWDQAVLGPSPLVLFEGCPQNVVGLVRTQAPCFVCWLREIRNVPLRGRMVVMHDGLCCDMRAQVTRLGGSWEDYHHEGSIFSQVPICEACDVFAGRALRHTLLEDTFWAPCARHYLKSDMNFHLTLDVCPYQAAPCEN